MPVRFRCVYCDQLLGIARRKAGSVVKCPHCLEELIVPTPEESSSVAVELPANEPEPTPDSMMDLLGAAQAEVSSAAVAEKPKPKPKPSAVKKPKPKKAKLFETDDLDRLLGLNAAMPEAEGLPPAPPAAMVPIFMKPLNEQTVPVGALVIRPERFVWLILGVIGLLAVGFVTGLLMGKMGR